MIDSCLLLSLPLLPLSSFLDALYLHRRSFSSSNIHAYSNPTVLAGTLLCLENLSPSLSLPGWILLPLQLDQKSPLQTGLVLFSIYSLSTPCFIFPLSLSKIILFTCLKSLPHRECHLLQRSPFSLLYPSA